MYRTNPEPGAQVQTLMPDIIEIENTQKDALISKTISERDNLRNKEVKTDDEKMKKVDGARKKKREVVDEFDINEPDFMDNIIIEIEKNNRELEQQTPFAFRNS